MAKYEVSTDGCARTISADSMQQDANSGHLLLIRNSEVVAVFRAWDSAIKVSE